MGQRLGQTRFGAYSDPVLLQTERSAFLLLRVQNLRRYIQRIRLCVGLLEIELAFSHPRHEVIFEPSRLRWINVIPLKNRAKVLDKLLVLC